MIWVDGPEAALDGLAEVTEGQADARAHLRHLGMAVRDYAQRRETWPTVTQRFHAVLEEARARVARE